MANNENSVITLDGGMTISLTKSEVETNFAKGQKITDGDYQQFFNLCKQHKLNPYCKEVWFIQLNGRSQIQIGKDGYFKMATSQPDFDGLQDGIIVSDDAGVVTDLEGCFVPPGKKLLGGWAKAYSKNRKYPKLAKVSMDEYAQPTNPLWKTKPAIMINKVAKSTALRDLYPSIYNGTYEESEVSETESIASVEGMTKTEKIENTEKPKVEEFDFLNCKITRNDGKPAMTIKEMIDSVKTLSAAAAVKNYFIRTSKEETRSETERKALILAVKAIENGTLKFANIK